MSYSIEVTSYFKGQSKRLLKKYPSLKQELFELITLLKTEPKHGTLLGNNCYKIRLAISSKGKGKSGGARIITNIQVVNKKVFLISIYDKSEQSTISEKQLLELLKYIADE